MTIQQFFLEYNWDANNGSYKGMMKHKDGDYVLFTDHAAEVERLKSELTVSRDNEAFWKRQFHTMYDSNETLKAEAYAVKCDRDGYMAALEKVVFQRDKLEGVLRLLEWGGNDKGTQCPICFKSAHEGHSSTCPFETL